MFPKVYMTNGIINVLFLIVKVVLIKTVIFYSSLIG